MKNWTLRQRILASFAVIIAIMLLMVVVSYSRLLKIETSQEAVRDDAVPGVYLSSMIRSAWVDSYLQTIDIIGLRDDKTFTNTDKNDYKSFEARIEQQMANYEKTIHGQADRMEFDNFKAAHINYNNVSDRATAAIDEAVLSAKISMAVSLLIAILAAGLCGLLLMRAIMAPMQRIVDILETMRDGDLSKRLNLERKDEFGAVETGFNYMMTELTALVSLAQRSSVQVTTSVTEIAATSKQQQATATETAATTTEIGATSREIAATSKDLVRTMTEVSTAADQASVAAGSGQQGLARMEETMHSVMGAADLVNAKLAILNEKAGNINQVVVTIVKVADQTNLLSLNAAIEAEKAGEYGRGFAVVATEVRRLADQTAVATYDIEQMVREIQSAVSAGVMGMDKFSEEVRRGMFEVQQVGEQLSQIIHQVQALAPRVLMVNEGIPGHRRRADQPRPRATGRCQQPDGGVPAPGQLCH